MKKIKLSTEKDIKKFYKLLPLYNSFIYKYTFFEIEEIDPDIRIINNVLNEKNRKKKIELIIDESCKYIDNYFENKNICGFNNCQCYTQREKSDKFRNGCCRKCIYQSNTGCKTKNVACKLFFCEEVRKRHPILLFKDINILKCLNLKQRYLIKYNYFSKKEDVIMDLYFNSLIIGTIRILIRLLINLYKLKKIKQ